MLLAGLLLAATPTLQLEWNAPARCPDSGWVLAEVTRIHPDVIAGDATGLVAKASVRELRGRWEVDVETRLGNATGRRRVTTESCTTAAQAAAVIVALALTQAPTAPLSAPSLVSAPEATAREVVLPPAPSSTRLVLALSAVARGAPLPDLAAGAAVSVGLWRKGLQVELTVFTPASQTIPAGRGHAHLELPLSGELAASLPVYEGIIELDVLVDLAAGLMHGWSEGIARPSPGGDAGWLALEAGAALRFALGAGFWARVEGRAGGSLLRPQFQVDGQDVFHASLFSARGGVGIEWLF